MSAKSEHTPTMLLKDVVLSRIEAALDRLGKSVDRPPARVEYAREEKFGDYACTVAMDKRFREAYPDRAGDFRNPRAFAESLASALTELEEGTPLFSRMEIAGPGFLNLSVTPAVLYRMATGAIREGEAYGRTKKPEPRRIIFEFVSANPTGPLNVVSARAAALGDSLCNLLEAAGEVVHREYYVNDYGNQVELLGRSCLLRHLEARGVPLRFATKGQDGQVSYAGGAGLAFPPEGYHGEYLSDVTTRAIAARPQLALSEELVSRAGKLGKSKHPAAKTPDAVQKQSEQLFSQAEFLAAAAALGRAVVDGFLETHRRDLEAFRVRFDNFFRESSLHESGAVLEAARSVATHAYTQEGKQIFRSTDFGDDKDRVIVREDGRPTYLLADIAYHKTKLDRGFTDIYNIWGPDHHGYIKRMEGALTALGCPPGKFVVHIAQQVNLLDEGKPIVMSKRTGRFITLETLLEEIPVDVSRYFFVMRSAESHLDFDFAEARDTTEKNPYYYVAYAHARIRSILSKAAERGLHPLADTETLPPLEMTDERRRLLFLCARFPEEVRDAALALEPHRLITFLYQLATALSRFYGPKENKIIEQPKPIADALLSILVATATCLKNGLALLGMHAPERLTREAEPPPE